ncbi:imidazolonepropionase [Thermosipho ferrireducens]|uniref:Imidazolonepropionase n=1 Tax=Thermosipho ferrireducens TaxID=2571116 RepID=A0ABX7SAN5_9BACT|nr:imidazolonepropionase [Thermosipho ferrireducens]QTA38837.1 imidazolonepropionase [Thermosipho ferrireducens]
MIYVHAERLLTPIGEAPKKGKEMSKIMEEFDVDIVLEKGKVVDILKHKSVKDFTLHVKLATPGLIDPHTHIPFYGRRAKEFYMRSRGKSYSEIFSEGGGIHSTVRFVRNATIGEIVNFNLPFLKEFLRRGVVAIEGKSGYGLDKFTELKQLKALKILNEVQEVHIAPTFLGFHAIPLDREKEDYVGTVKTWLDDVKAFSDTVDVFCDYGVFLPEDIEGFFVELKKNGFKLRFHADEIKNVGATRLAVKLGAVSADHLLKITDDDIREVSNSDTVAVLMPGTSFYLGEEYAPARKLIEYGAAVALASDFNPGSCPVYEPAFVMHLALKFLKMEPEEILTAYTLNAAYVLGIENGAILPGRKCDIALWNTTEFLDIPYMFQYNFLSGVVINGKVKLYENVP